MIFKKKEECKLEKEIGSILEYLEGQSPESDEYAKAMDNLDKLVKLKAVAKPKVGKEVIITVAGNLIGIVAILGFEKANILTSKALSMIIKPKF